MPSCQPIGVFDSGYGGLTVLKSIVKKLPSYDFIYLGDNARAPYGNRSFETVYQYTRECVQWFFSRGCPLVILACNTASAKALRTIQQQDLLESGTANRVLGVIRPTTELAGLLSKSGHVGILATSGTVNSESYVLEINRFFPHVKVFQQACPLWVPLIENNEHEGPGADFFVKKYVGELLQQSSKIDTVVLACTHYPLLMDKLGKCMPDSIKLVAQGDIVADSLVRYLKNHPEMDDRCSKQGKLSFFTTDDNTDFDRHGRYFYGKGVRSERVFL
ncbi:MAG: glutamate racemase [Bacteroidota bacterium]|nr:glutamate racemase [Bacteroidota bacterium]